MLSLIQSTALTLAPQLRHFKSLQERASKQSEAAKADYEELKGRAKTKCDNCGKMTGIKLKNFKFTVVV